MILIKGQFLGASPKESKGYKYLEVAVENQKSMRYPHIVKCAEDYNYKKDIDKNGDITIPNIYCSCWSDRVKKFSPIGVNFSYSNKA